MTDQPCPQCGGSGNQIRQCFTCGGIGMQPDQATGQPVTCRACGGTCQAPPQPCPGCGGTGRTHQ